MNEIMIWFMGLLGDAAHNVLSAVILLVIGLLVIRLVMNLVKKGLEKSKLEKAAHTLILSLSQVALYLLLGLCVASSLGIDVTGIVALASVLTLAVSLALQNALTNVIGGFTLLSTHPFHSGDFVEIAGQSGTVEEISMTYTKLATPDNYEVPSQKVIDARVLAGTVDNALLEPAPVAMISGYGESAINYSLRIWVKSENYWDVYFLVNQRVKQIFDEQGVYMTYPHLNIHVKQ